MPQWKFHGCPRCHGDLHVGKDDEGALTEECLQCSWSQILQRPKDYEQIRQFDLQVRASLNSQR
jgi:hypothetical protein